MTDTESEKCNEEESTTVSTPTIVRGDAVANAVTVEDAVDVAVLDAVDVELLEAELVFELVVVTDTESEKCNEEESTIVSTILGETIEDENVEGEIVGEA